jgi:contractile injection system tube protein/LysM domain-containing protein
MSMKKATLAKLEGGTGVEPVLTVMFNPKDLTLSKSNTWNPKKTPKENTPELEFGSGGSASLKLQLFFDTYADAKDVRKVFLNQIYQWTRVDPKLKDKTSKKGRPPEVRFHWGAVIFDGVIQSLSQKLSLFLPDGTPVRAVVDLTMTESRDGQFFPKQNPTSGGPGGDRVWVVRAGDTLPWIAYSEYKDATEWRAIADANGLTQVRALQPGTVLVIPNG